MNNLKLLYNKLLEFKDKGNKEFTLDNKSKKASTFYLLAIELYNKFYKELSLKEDSIENEKEISKLMGIIYSNLSLVYLNRNEIDKALESSNNGIAIDNSNSNSKCYYRNSNSKRLLCLFQESLESIEKAIEIEKNLNGNSNLISQYEKEKKEIQVKIEKSIKEEQDFENRMKRDNDQFNQFKNNCSIRYKPGYGRITKANSDLKKDDIVLRVAPFASSLEYDSLYKYCSFCLQKIKDKSEREECKCNICNFEVICKSCRNLEGNTALEYHNEVCDILAFIYLNHKESVKESVDFRFMIRVFINICKSRNHGKDSRNPTVYSNKQSNDGRPYISDSDNDFINLSRDSKVYDKEQLEKFKRGVSSIQNLVSVVRGNGYFKNLSKNEMLSLYSNVLTNAHSITHPVKQKELGKGIFPSACYFNHSCNPNCHWYLDDQGMMVIATLRNVKKDEELFISYIGNGETLENRRDQLLGYSFFCQCELCEFQNTLTGLLCENCKEPLYENSVQYHEPIDPNDTGISFKCSKCNQIKNITIKTKDDFNKEIENELLNYNSLTKDIRTFSQINIVYSKIESIREYEKYKLMIPPEQFETIQEMLPLYIKNLNNQKKSDIYQELVDSVNSTVKELNQVLSHPLCLPFSIYYVELFQALKSENSTDFERLSLIKQLIISNLDQNLYNNHKDEINNFLKIK